MPNFQEPEAAGRGQFAPDIVNSRHSHLSGNLVASVESTGVGFSHLDPTNSYNPPFDQRIWQQPSGGMGTARAPKLLRGRISMWKVEKNKLPNAPGRRSRSLNFLYNPTTISHAFSFSGDLPPPDAVSEDDPSRPLMTGQSVSWKLLFNRMYESAYAANEQQPYNETGEFSSGVLQDTSALQYMLGSHDGAAIQSTLVVVMFGATKGQRPFAYFGWITDCQINYLMFTHRMIPTVAEVDLTLARSTITTSGMVGGAWDAFSAANGGTSGYTASTQAVIADAQAHANGGRTTNTDANGNSMPFVVPHGSSLGLSLP